MRAMDNECTFVDDYDIMGPQPLSKVRPKATYRFGNGVFETHADLSVVVIRVINTGAIAEWRWAGMLIDLMSADVRTGLAMYEALSGAESRRAALLAAARTKLCADDYLLFKAVMMAVAPARRTRNNFAHWLWGESDEMPNALLLVDPAEHNRVFVSAVETNLKMKLTGRFLVPDRLDSTKIQVWTKKGLESADKESTEAMGAVSDLGAMIHWLGEGIDNEMRSRLSQRPIVSQALQRLKKQSAQ